VCTTAATPHPGQRLTPGQALATDLLRECTHRASDVRYWQGQDKAMALVLDLHDPEGLGYADKAALVAAARDVLGRPLGLGNPPAPHCAGTTPTGYTCPELTRAPARAGASDAAKLPTRSPFAKG
jgi:hypothetical protein